MINFFLVSLRRINEDDSVPQMPRRRSNSLPIPKIEVSIYQSPESKKKEEGREYQEYADQRESVLSAGKFFRFYNLQM